MLASTSPRRRSLLAEAGLDFKVETADVDESTLPGERAQEMVVRLALAKACAAAAGRAEGLVLGADTIVVLDGEALGKPSDEQAARDMLNRLRGRGHLVMTAMAVVNAASGFTATDVEYTGVWLRDFGTDELEAYIASGDPLDKAGAYAIQHEGFRPVARIQGSACNVIGLPIALTLRLIERVDRAG